jgi:hypothetical protein
MLAFHVKHAAGPLVQCGIPLAGSPPRLCTVQWNGCSGTSVSGVMAQPNGQLFGLVFRVATAGPQRSLRRLPT